VAELGWRLLAGALLVDRPILVVAHEHAQAVAIEVARQTVTRREPPQQLGVTVQVFFGAQVQREDATGGIVQRPQQARPRLIGTEPRMIAGIDQHQRAFARFAQPPLTMLRGSMTSRRSDAGGAA